MFQVRMRRRNVVVHHCVFNAEIPSNNGTQSDLQSVFSKVSAMFQVLRYNLLKKIQNTSKSLTVSPLCQQTPNKYCV